MNHTRVGIIGAGASGLMSAILLARRGIKVTLFEKNDKIAKKLLITGNGRCNISNRDLCAEHYFSRTKNLSGAILQRFDLEKTLSIFESIGISVKELENGKLYPYSLEAKTVVKSFLYELEHLGIEVIYGANVKKIEKKEHWLVSYEQKVTLPESKQASAKNQTHENTRQKKRDPANSSGKSKDLDKITHLKKDKESINILKTKLSFDNIILCTGGMSYSSSGSDGSGYDLAKSSGHSIIKPIPAIVQLVMNEKNFPYYKHLSGVKTQTRLHLTRGDEVIRTEEGELLFTSYGLSGPAILLLSSNVALEQARGNALQIAVDFFPEMKYFELKEFLEKKLLDMAHLNIEHLLEMFLPNRLISVLLKCTGICADKLAKEITKKERQKILEFLKDLRLDVVKPYLWEQAQVTAGGVSCKEVDERTLESKKAKGLYFAGEILDIDGDCGGFNLQWAWSSAMAVVEAIANGDFPIKSRQS